MRPRCLLLAGVLIGLTLALSAWRRGESSIPPAGPQAGAEPFDEDRLEKDVLVPACTDPMGIDVVPDGRLLWIERKGEVRMYLPTGRKVLKLGTVPTAVFGEVGMLGMAADRDFARTGWVCLFFCPEKQSTTMRLSRFTIAGDKLDLASEKKLLDYKIDVAGAIHMGGGLAMDGRGNLYVGVGDNCPPIPEVPIDLRPGKEISDAFRSAGNSRDLRGKVLRIHPEPDGTYTIPQDNLWPDGKDGRPETFAMGCRNPFRLSVDPKTHWLYFGDVGPNVEPQTGIMPEGYDEVNQARRAGNYGWPFCTGPNEPFTQYDFATKKVGPPWDLKNLVNPSPNNTGLKKLPPPIPAFIWYATGPSKEFPELGSGGRSAMVGPVYYDDASLKSDVKLPVGRYDRTLFFFDWMRNWIKAVHMDKDYRIARIEPFLPRMAFRKPIDIRTGPEGALYIAEYGDRWGDNHDAQIVRIVYRRGNRPPVAIAEAHPRAGKHPLTVTLDGRKSFDKDKGDTLSYAWKLPGGQVTAGSAPTAKTTFDKPGVYDVLLTVTDSHGAASMTKVQVAVGNAPPRVRFFTPGNGEFFDWDQPIEYKVVVEDDEDGSTTAGTIPADRVSVQAAFLPRRDAGEGDNVHPGLALMRKTTCFACHAAGDQSKGPPYALVAQKYQKDAAARERLAKKVITGGAGAWGAYPMPPHPQHTPEQTRLMVDWIMTLTAGHQIPPTPGTEGGFTALHKPDLASDHGVYVLTARYTDQGAAGAAPLTGEAVCVLHSRIKKAAFADLLHHVEVVHELEGKDPIYTGMMARFAPNGYVRFDQMNLAGIERVDFFAGSAEGARGDFVIHADSPSGPVVAQVSVEDKPGYRVIPSPVKDPGGVHDLYVVAEGASGKGALSLLRLDFHDSPAAAAVRKKANAEAAQRAASRQKLFKARPFVKDWKMDDLAGSLGELERGRSFANGKALFQTASCVMCHRMGKEGGTLGPDLSEIAKKLAKQPMPRLALLREVLDPSAVIDEKYRTHIVFLDDGTQKAGIIVDQDKQAVRLAANLAAPDERITIPRERIEALRKSDVSMMPVGLVSSLNREEILDLLAYIESGGNPQYPAFRKE
jgi:cytochrome c